MKNWTLLVSIMFASSAFAGADEGAGAAVSACKSYIDNLYQDAVSRKVKKI